MRCPSSTMKIPYPGWLCSQIYCDFCLFAYSIALSLHFHSYEPQPGPSGIQRALIERNNATNAAPHCSDFSFSSDDEFPTNVYVPNVGQTAQPVAFPPTTIATHHPCPLTVDWLLDNDTDDSSSSSVEYIPPVRPPVRAKRANTKKILK